MKRKLISMYKEMNFVYKVLFLPMVAMLITGHLLFWNIINGFMFFMSFAVIFVYLFLQNKKVNKEWEDYLRED
ncbi:TPA: hypothetical protein N2D99_002083 [Clostridium botulinum]|nr:hypothetical protein [Clostridium botulinum]